MSTGKEHKRQPKKTRAETAHIALERRHGKNVRLPREWTIGPEDLGGMSEDEKAEWLALYGNGGLNMNRGMTRRTRGTLEDAADGRARPEGSLPSMQLPNRTQRLRKLR